MIGKTNAISGVSDPVPKIRTVSGSVISISNALAMPAASLAVDIDAVQSGSGDPSPDNVRPITGFTGVNIWRTGTNVCEEEFEDGYITASGALSSYQYAIRSKNYNSCVPNTQYYYKITPGISGVNIAWYDASKTFIQRDSDRGNTVITAPSNARFFKLSIYNYKSVNPTYSNDISINYPSTVTDYEPYQGNLYTIDLDGTVYGGTLDVTTGVLTVDRAMQDLGELDWGYSSVTNGSGDTVPVFRSLANVISAKAHAKGLSSAYDVANGGTYATCLKKIREENCSIWINSSYWSSSSLRIVVRNDAYTDADLFKTAVSGVQLVYELATPQTYQLTATEVQMLLGNNTLWADSGDTELQYWARR